MYNYDDCEQRRIMDKSRNMIQELVSGTVLDLGCGSEPIKGDYTICVDLYEYLWDVKDVEFHEFDITSPKFFKQGFLKKEIDYVTLNAVICNIIDIDNPDDVVEFIKKLKEKAKKKVIISGGEYCKDLLVKHFDNAVVEEVNAPENYITLFKKAYVLVI